MRTVRGPALTAVEKIIGRHAGGEVHAGDTVVVNLDTVMLQDGNAPLIINLWQDFLSTLEPSSDCDVVIVIDHSAPSPNRSISNLQSKIRKFAEDFGTQIYDVGEGISHILLPEQGHITPGAIVVGSDSHTISYGALNALGIGLGASDVAVAMATGRTWLRVPETLEIHLDGTLSGSAAPKDVALTIIDAVGVDGADYKCLEIIGPALHRIGLDGRLTIASMGVEMGAKATLMSLDDVTKAYLQQRNVPISGAVSSDPDALTSGTISIDVGRVQPLVALPHDLSQIVPVRSLGMRIPVHQAFLGTCTNSRIDDLRAAAMVLQGRRVHKNVRLIVTPGSRAVYRQALNLGYVEILNDAGAVITPPGCGACVGLHLGVPADGETVISSANRNFRGRMGNPSSSIILGSPSTVAASAVLGRVASAEDLW